MRLHSEIVIETEQTDTCYHRLISRGDMDFADDFVAPRIEAGIRIDTEPNFDSSMIVYRIVQENMNQLYQLIQFPSPFFDHIATIPKGKQSRNSLDILGPRTSSMDPLGLVYSRSLHP